MDNTSKYLHLKHKDKSVYEIVDEMMEQYKSILVTIKKTEKYFRNFH